jgi:hypothetical protein
MVGQLKPRLHITSHSNKIIIDNDTHIFPDLINLLKHSSTVNWSEQIGNHGAKIRAAITEAQGACAAEGRSWERAT